MLTEGFIKVPRSFTQDPLYKNQNAKVLLFHLVLNANYKDGKELKRGQIHTSFRRLADELGLSLQNVRTALATLLLTQKITRSLTHNSLLITICDYDAYQGAVADGQHSEQHDGQHTFSHEVAERKYAKKENTKELFEEAEARPCALSPPQKEEAVVVFTPPTLEEVAAYVKAKQYHVDPSRFFSHDSAMGWRTKAGTPVNDWQRKVDEWESKETHRKQSTSPVQQVQTGFNTKQAANEYAIASLLA